MARKEKSKDRDVRAIENELRSYCASHSVAKVQVRRQNSVSIHIRIVDPDFKGMDLVDRDTKFWKILDQLPEDVRSQITVLLLLTPIEAKTSFANLEFDHPVKSLL